MLAIVGVFDYDITAQGTECSKCSYFDHIVDAYSQNTTWNRMGHFVFSQNIILRITCS